MRKILESVASICAFLALASCAKTTPEQMAEGLKSLKIVCEPAVLTDVDGKVDAKIEITFPKKYFHQEARVIVLPVLVCDDSTEIEGSEFIYQGEKIKDNYKTVAWNGASVRETVFFTYKECMRKSRLELRPRILLDGKTVASSYIKVADGVNTTARLACLDGRCEFKADGYEKVLHKTAEAQIMYDVNSSRLKSGQIKGESVEDYQDAIEDIKKNDRYTIKGTSIVSYASPEGGKTYNEKLSDKRSATAQKAWDLIGKGMEAEELDIKSIGQDWEGFKDAVRKSHIKDKDLILRVLSMYNDPAVRESEIRNLSQIYSELKSEVFPALRRSRFITSLEYQNYSDEDLEILSRQKIYMLDEPGLLHLAAVTESVSRKEFIYNFTYEKFGSKTALFNAAALALSQDMRTKAEVYLAKLADEEDVDVINARGVIELRARNWYKSEDLFEKAASDLAKRNLGTLYILQGNYSKAVSVMPDSDEDKPVACIMAGDLDRALSLLKGNDARTDYLKAIVAARLGNVTEAKTLLESAGKKDASFKAMAAKDVEFRQILQ